MTLAICMIARNEEKTIKRAIESVRGFYDQLVVIDTGSTDQTVEVARSCGAKVEQFPWGDDFSVARNHAFQYSYCDWTMALDCDEYLVGDIPALKNELDRILTDLAVSVIVVNIAYKGNTLKFKSARICRTNRAQWQGAIHESLEPLSGKVVQMDLTIVHDKGIKFENGSERNIRICERELQLATGREKERYTFYLGREYKETGRYEDAIKVFESYVKIGTWKEELHRAYCDLAECYYLTKQFEKAHNACEMALKINENIPDPYYIEALISYDMKLWGQVISWCMKALELKKPEFVLFDVTSRSTYDLWDLLAVAHWYGGDRSIGKSFAEMCAEADPTNQRFKDNLELFKSL